MYWDVDITHVYRDVDVTHVYRDIGTCTTDIYRDVDNLYRNVGITDVYGDVIFINYSISRFDLSA